MCLGWNVLTLDVVTALGLFYFDQKRFNEAEAAFQRSIAGSKKVHGQEDPHTLVRTCGLGRCHTGIGKEAKAEATYTQALNGMENVHKGRALIGAGCSSHNGFLLCEIREVSGS